MTEAQKKALEDGADAAYDREDRQWFYKLTTEELVHLWTICCDINQGAAWDDEVYDALAERNYFGETA